MFESRRHRWLLQAGIIACLGFGRRDEEMARNALAFLHHCGPEIESLRRAPEIGLFLRQLEDTFALALWNDFDARTHYALANPRVSRAAGIDPGCDDSISAQLASAGSSRLRDIRAVDIAFSLPNDMLPKFDIATRVFGIEGRPLYRCINVPRQRKVIEALFQGAAGGRPIVATDVPGCREIARSGANALLVEPNNPKMLADAISTLAFDTDLRRRLGAAGRRLTQEEFSSEHIGQAMLAIYKQLIDPA